MGYDFQGIYNIWEKNINLFASDAKKNIDDVIEITDIQSEEVSKLIGEKATVKLREELELVEEVYPPFDREAYLAGQL